MPFGVFRLIIALSLISVLSLASDQDTENEVRLKSQIKLLLESLKEANQTTQEALAIHNPEKHSTSKEDKNTLAEAIAEIESLRSQNFKLKDVIYQMVELIEQEAPELNEEVETFIQKIQPTQKNVGFNNAKTAEIIGYDAKTGLVVLNAGEAQGVKPGMQYVFFGSDSKENRLVVADVRENIAGALVLEGAGPIQIGLEVNLVIQN